MQRLAGLRHRNRWCIGPKRIGDAARSHVPDRLALRENPPRLPDADADDRRAAAERELRRPALERMKAARFRRTRPLGKDENVPPLLQIRRGRVKEPRIVRKRGRPHDRRHHGIRPKAVLGDVKRSANTLSFVKDSVSVIKSGKINKMQEALDRSRTLTKRQALSSTNADDQTAAIQRIAEIAQTNPVAAKGLLKDQVFGKLTDIINADTSKLEGPKGTPDPKNLSPLEKAEINKQFAVYTLAILQKNFREEINQLMKKNNLPDIAINDIPFIKEGIVNNLKDNPNPTVREACLSALNYIGRPEDKEVLRTLYSISAKHDANADVKKTANDYLAKLPA